MQSTISLLHQLKNDFPQFKFKQGDDFHWSSSDNTIYYNSNVTNQSSLLLHELSHALLGHANYDRDIQLITMERQAWDHSIILANKYNIIIPNQIIVSTIDSYRDWLHARSTCPKCSATGVQSSKHNTYTCPACSNKWRVNEARLCGLRRYDIK